MDLERSLESLIENAARQDAQLQGIRNLIEGGMKLVVASQAETNRKLDALLDAQLRTETKLAQLAETQESTGKKLETLIDSLSRPRDGHGA